ncbi:MAG TPA: exodeoxyribonuclease VII large subunit [Thermodesulfobacteriota bacterium]|nr:exodeoxyribonuclease VII large subunit [Thermodesulfobacteriota bacterium]
MSFRPIYTVSQLTREIRSLLEGKFEHVWVEGEISNFRSPGSGHLYFTLKDEAAQVRAVMFRMQNRLLKFAPEDGLKVIAYGRISVYEPRGEYQMIVDYLEPKGLGALQLAFEQLKEKLAGEGLFDPAHKRPLPPFPQKIGIVTSVSGAAIRDILHIIDRRYAGVQILIHPVRVQGAGAAQDIAHAVDALSEWPGLDVIIVGRGGGSLEDLWAFNEEAVARAIYRSKVPVISAVGHETDVTIADLVADLRAPTPSAAAELVVRNKADLIQSVDGLLSNLCQAGRFCLDARRERLSSLARLLVDPRKRLAEQKSRLEELSSRLAASLRNTLAVKRERFSRNSESLHLLSPGRRIAELRRRLSDVAERALMAVRSRLRMMEQRVGGIAGKLQTLSPLAVLERGYSIARVIPSGEIVRDAARLETGNRVRVRLHKGDFAAVVEEVEKE